MEEQELVRMAQTGDSGAFSSLVVKTMPVLKSILRKTFPAENDFDDICQDSYKKAYLAIAQYNPKYSQFITWLTVIAKRTALDHFKARRETTSLDASPQEICDCLVDSPEESFISEQACRKLIEGIAALPDLYREIAELRFLNEFAYEEIAAATSLPLNTVRTRIRRAKKILTQEI